MVGVSSEGSAASMQSPQSRFCDAAGLNAHARPGRRRREGWREGGREGKGLCEAGKRLSVCLCVANRSAIQTLQVVTHPEITSGVWS